MRLRLAWAPILLFCACAEEETPPPPPIGMTSGQSSFNGGGADGGNQASDEEDGSGSQDATGPTAPVLLGGVLDTEEDIPTPINCAIRFYELNAIDPGTGLEVEVYKAQFIFEVPAWPASFEVDEDDAEGLLETDESGYVAALCDGDGNNIFDDGLGGFYPGLPLEEVVLPALELEIAIATVQ